ncbi:MAG: FecR domain-containing protein [Porticoccaceae bacterium]|nr:FecR domain-containing protein [Porticoccaceae bacterium]
MDRISSFNCKGLSPVFLAALAVALLSGLFAATPAWASSNWQITAVSGDVSYYQQDTDTWANVASGSDLALPFTIKTGSGASAELRREGDTISVSAETVLEFPLETAADQSVLTRIIEKIGFALFRIKPGKARTLAVETPYLVSVVKGTTFSVHATESRAVVNLIVGELDINAVTVDHKVSILSGEVALLAAGEKKITVISPSQAANDSDSGGGGGAGVGPVDAVIGEVAASVDVLTPRVVAAPTIPDSPTLPDTPTIPDTPTVPDDPDVPPPPPPPPEPEPCPGKSCEAPGQN